MTVTAVRGSDAGHGRVSRRALLAGLVGAPLLLRSSAVAVVPPVVGTTPDDELALIDPLTREPLAGPRLSLARRWALLVSGDRRRVLMRTYYQEPFRISTAETSTLHESRSFLEGVSSVKGAVIAWPVGPRMMIAKDENPSGDATATTLEIRNPLNGNVALHTQLGSHMAGGASCHRGVVLALAPLRPEPGDASLAIVDWHGGVRTVPLPGFAVDYVRGSRQPFAMLAFSPDQTSVLIGSSHSLVAVTLTTGRIRRLKPTGGAVEQLAWLTADAAVAVTRRSWNSSTRVILLDLGSHRQKVVGETTSLIAPIARGVVFAPTDGGVTTFTANGALLAHVAGTDSLMLSIPSSGAFVMAVPKADHLGPGRRVVVDARTGALVLDQEFDRAPCYVTQIAGRDYG